MKVSTKGRYAVRLMLELALHYQREIMPIKSIAQRQEISLKYLEQIIPSLVKANLVQSMRGAQGGYSLLMPPEAITVGQILCAAEGPFIPVECVGQDPVTCRRFKDCVTVQVWQKVKKAVDDVVDSITLADLVEDYNSKVAAYNYTI